MPVIRSVGTLATCRADGRQDEIHTIRDAAMAWTDDGIQWVGEDRHLPTRFGDWKTWRLPQSLVIPGLVDCHTHLAFGGWRADEFEARSRGTSYLDIARAGGGIRRTVEQTRASSPEELFDRCLGFLTEMASLGVTTVECKSGYGLTFEEELKLLEVYRKLDERQPLRVVSTFLGAHTLPPEYEEDRAAYVDLVQRQMIPAVAEGNLARFCDVFVEDSAFTLDEARAIFRTAADYGLRPRLHADQLSEGGGGALAADVGAASADHLEHTSAAGIAALSKAGVVAVSLPLATLYLRQPPLEARQLIDAGVAVAVATDFNPGSAPSFHLPLAMTLACTTQGMSPSEALKGATLIAARSLDLEEKVGSLEVGKAADFAVIDAPDVNHWLCHFRANACQATFAGGHLIHGSESMDEGIADD